MVDIDPVDRQKIENEYAINELDIEQRHKLAIEEVRQLQQMLQAERATGGLLAKSKVEAAARKAAEKARDEKRREASRKDTPQAKVAAMEAPVEPNAGTVDPAQMMTTDLTSLPMGSRGGGPQFIQGGGGGGPAAMASDQLLQTPNFVVSGRQTNDVAPEQISSLVTAPVQRQRTETFVEPNFEGQQLSLQRDLALMKMRQTDQKTYIERLATAAVDPRQLDSGVLMSHAATLDAEGRKQLEAAILSERSKANVKMDTARTLIGKYNADFKAGLISDSERRDGIAKVLRGDSTNVNVNLNDPFGFGQRGQNEVDVAQKKASDGRNRLDRIAKEYDASFYKAGSGLSSAKTGFLNAAADIGDTIGVPRGMTDWVRPTEAQKKWWADRADHRGQVINDSINAVYDISGAASRQQELENILLTRPSVEDQPPVFEKKMDRLLTFGNMGIAANNIAKLEYGSNTTYVPDSEVGAYMENKMQEFQAQLSVSNPEFTPEQNFNAALQATERLVGVQPGYGRKVLEKAGVIRGE